MTTQELNALADLRSANIARQSEWDKDSQITLAYRGNELAGEVGEACNVIKKIERERLGIAGSRDTVAHLAEELADVVICADLIAMHEGIDLLGSAVPEKFNATSEKVGLKTRLLRTAATSQASVKAMREACKQVALAYASQAADQIERNNDYYSRSGTKDTGANDCCRSTKFTAEYIAAAIDTIEVQAGIEPPLTDGQIKHMVDRFLGWALPENFNPDGGVSFKRLENRHHHPDASPFYPMPTGTNLFDAIQATEMVRYMVEGLKVQAGVETQSSDGEKRGPEPSVTAGRDRQPISASVETATPAQEVVGYVCTGCGRLAKDPVDDMKSIRARGAVSCCPERNMKAVYLHPAPAPSGTEAWRPIETAPKEGKDKWSTPRLRLWDGNRERHGRWETDSYAKKPRPFWRYSDSIGVTDDRQNQPTHWQPISNGPDAALSTPAQQAVDAEAK